MLKNFFGRILTPKPLNTVYGSFLARNFSSGNIPFLPGVPGGGLEKLQGGIREERYFNCHDRELIAKIRERIAQPSHSSSQGLHGSTGLSRIIASGDGSVTLKQTCSANKNRICLEEVFFLNEQSGCLKILQRQANRLASNSNPKITVRSGRGSGSGSKDGVKKDDTKMLA